MKLKLYIMAFLTMVFFSSCENKSTMTGSGYSNKELPAGTMIHGHILPPEPDPAINNATLLGVDSNGNGVRDDVERWIYTRYNEYYPCDFGFYKIMVHGKEKFYSAGNTLPDDIKELVKISDTGRHTAKKEDCAKTPTPYHPIVREIAMQGAKAAQIIIQQPENARQTMKFFDAATDCAGYFEFEADINNEPILLDHYIFGKEFKAIQFNTSKRSRAFGRHNAALSGGVYDESDSSLKMRSKCDFDVDALLGK